MALSAGSIEIRLFAELARLQSDMKKANRVVEDAMGGIQKSVKATGAVFSNLAGAFGAVQIVKLMDDYKRFDSQLKLSTKNLTEYGQAYANVIRIGRTAQSDIGAIGVLYARLNNNLRDFNVTQKQVAGVTETITLALRVNNATVQETNSVMLQLSQSFGSGKLNGQEFLAVAEGAPMLLRQLAKSLGVPFGALKDLSAQGKLTREDLLKAWSDPAYLATLREQVKAVGTITSAITVLMNNLKQYIGEADKATGTSRLLAEGIKFIADNINLLVTGAIAYGIVSFTKWTQSVYASTVASKLKNAETIRSTMLSKAEADQTAINTQNKIALDNLKVVAQERANISKVEALSLEARTQAAQIKTTELTLVQINAERAQEAIKLQSIKTTYQQVQASLAHIEALKGNAAVYTSSLLAIEKEMIAIQTQRQVATAKLIELSQLSATVQRELSATQAAAIVTQKELNVAQGLGAVSLANNASASTKASYEATKVTTAQRALAASTGTVATAIRGMNVALAAVGGWVGLGVTALILFSDKILQIIDRVRGLTPELKELNDELEREARLKGIGISSSDPNAAGLEKQTKVIQLQMSLIRQRNQLYKDISNRNDVNSPLTAEHAAAIEKVSIAIEKNKEILASLALANEAAGASARGMSAEYIALSKTLKTIEFLTTEYNQAQALVRAELVAGNITSKTAGQQLMYLSEQYKKATGEIKAAKAALKDLTEAKAADARFAATRNDWVRLAQQTDDKITDHLNKMYADSEKAREKLRERFADMDAKFVKIQDDAEQKRRDDFAKKEKAAADLKQKEFEKSVDKYNDIFREGFADMVNGGKSTWKSFTQSLVTTFKTTVADQIYKMFAQPFVVKIVASMLGMVGATGAAVAGEAVSGVSGGGFSLGTAWDIATKGFNNAGKQFTAAVGDFGNWIGGLDDSGGLLNQLGTSISTNQLLISQGLSFSGAALSLLKGDVKGAAFQGAGAALGLTLTGGNPLGGAIGSMLGGALGGLFGGKKIPRFDSNVKGTFDSNTKAYSTAQGATAYKSLGANGQLGGLGEAFSRSLDAILSGFGIGTDIKTNNRLVQKRKSSYGMFDATFDGQTVGAGIKGSAKSTAATFASLVETVLGTTLVQAIQKSKLPEGIRALFSGLVKKEEVSNMIAASLSLQDAQKQLGDRFGLTVSQAGLVSVATGLVGDELAKFATELATTANGFKTVGDVMIQSRTQLETSFGGELPATLNAFDNILKGIDKTTRAGIESFVELFSIRNQFAAFTQALDALKGNVRGSLFSMVSEAEKQQMLNEDLAKLFGSLGRDVPTSVQELIALGKSIDYTTKEGLDLAAVFPSLVQAFSATKDSVDSLMRSLLDANRFKTQTDFIMASAFAQNGVPLSALPSGNMPSYAVGTSYVPNDGVAMLHQGEAVLTRSENADIGVNTSQMVQLLSSLITQVTQLKYDIKRGADASDRTARELEDITSGDIILNTQVA